MARTAWTLKDNSTGSTVTYTFPFNPKDFTPPGRQGNISQNQTASSSGATILFQGRDTASSGQFKGMARSETQLTDIKTWSDKWYPLILTDDLGRSWNILITNVGWTRVRKINNIWLHEYVIDFLEVA